METLIGHYVLIEVFLGNVADYLVFMAYDQYGTSSTKPGTTAGLNWVETSLKKIIDYDEVDTEK